MKLRRMFTVCALLGALIVSSWPAFADERPVKGDTGLGGPTISGSVSSTAGGQLQGPAHGSHADWWHRLIHWLGVFEQ
jgi:hypothetical protein